MQGIYLVPIQMTKMPDKHYSKRCKLKAGNQTAEGYRMIVEGRDPHNACTQHQIYEM